MSDPTNDNPNPNYQCDACRQGVHCFGPRCDCCNREPEVIRTDLGGWISGPSLSPVQTIEQFLHRYGDRWALEEHPGLGVYTAVARPTPSSEHVLAAHTVWELAAKVDQAERSGDDPR